MSRKNKDIFVRLTELNQYFDDLLDYFGYQTTYTPKEIKKLWKKSKLTVDNVADRLYRSKERAAEYCYGMKMSRRLMCEIAKFFKQEIYANVYKNNLKNLGKG